MQDSTRQFMSHKEVSFGLLKCCGFQKEENKNGGKKSRTKWRRGKSRVCVVQAVVFILSIITSGFIAAMNSWAIHDSWAFSSAERAKFSKKKDTPAFDTFGRDALK